MSGIRLTNAGIAINSLVISVAVVLAHNRSSNQCLSTALLLTNTDCLTGSGATRNNTNCLACPDNDYLSSWILLFMYTTRTVLVKGYDLLLGRK